MKLQSYLDHVTTGQIPPEPPDGLSPGGYGFTRFQEWQKYHEARDECNKRGMWSIADMVWTKQLADWIGQRSVLEIMAGGGWIAKALNQHGVDIVATDDYSWAGRHSQMVPVYPVGRLNALEAVLTIPADILLVSWDGIHDYVMIGYWVDPRGEWQLEPLEA